MSISGFQNSFNNKSIPRTLVKKLKKIEIDNIIFYFKIGKVQIEVNKFGKSFDDEIISGKLDRKIKKYFNFQHIFQNICHILILI